MQPFYTTLTFWISVLVWLATLGGHYANLIPAPYGLVIANGVAIIYASVRCLQKRQAGVAWKGIFFTSEFVVTALTVLTNFLESLKALPVMTPKALTIISGIIAAMVTLLHTLSSDSARSGGANEGQFEKTPPSFLSIVTTPNKNVVGEVSGEDVTKPFVPKK